jgi:hypothetical protein
MRSLSCSQTKILIHSNFHGNSKKLLEKKWTLERHIKPALCSLLHTCALETVQFLILFCGDYRSRVTTGHSELFPAFKEVAGFYFCF